MWEARAEYEDGTTVERLFADNLTIGEEELRYRLECWLIERHPGCTRYSVNYVFIEEEE